MTAKTLAAMCAFGFTPADAPESDATPDPTPVPGFDGGARRHQSAPAETHGATLLQIIRREPDWPADWPWPHA